MTQVDLMEALESPPQGPDDGEDDEAEEISVSASRKRKPKPLMRSPVRKGQSLQWTRAR